jgi:hypothetical protein
MNECMTGRAVAGQLPGASPLAAPWWPAFVARIRGSIFVIA